MDWSAESAHEGKGEKQQIFFFENFSLQQMGTITENHNWYLDLLSNLTCLEHNTNTLGSEIIMGEETEIL